jgi:hypothetical protein
MAKNGVIGCAYIILDILGAKLPYAILFIAIITSLFCWLFSLSWFNKFSIKFLIALYLLIALVTLIVSSCYGDSIYLFFKKRLLPLLQQL